MFTSSSTVDPCTTSPFTRANGPSKQIPQYPKQPYSITSKFGSFSNFSKAACEPLARLPTQNSINGLIKILPPVLQNKLLSDSIYKKKTKLFLVVFITHSKLFSYFIISLQNR
ncbi:hypothetical protein BALH_4474 [Bacillus thuringiensis str. Al Hakam]|nr:hypothetical protein BALH_4474 [Bacillus thuringiensis str. Al Hakam]